ncbi:MAG: 50S ribosomal protein L11 methyltransferase [Prolixibacteraceae bacterium]
MRYLKIDIHLNPHKEWFRDVLTAQLAEIGFESFMESEKGVEAFIPVNEFNEPALKALISDQPANIKITWTKEIIEDKNWNEEWEKNYFQPLLIGDECVIRAPFHKEFPKEKYEVIIEPNMAFGTGNHETTSMMVESILQEKLEGKSVLDMGCGTGILGILASMKGAEKITAIDISEWAVSGTKENAVLNKVTNISANLGDASLLGNESYDLILANIQRNVLIADMEKYAENLKKNGKIFLSGFYSEDLPDIKIVAEKRGLRYISHQTRKNWVVAIMQKK